MTIKNEEKKKVSRYFFSNHISYCVLFAFSSSANFLTISWFDIIGSGNPASEIGSGHPKPPIIDVLVTFGEISTVELSEIGCRFSSSWTTSPRRFKIGSIDISKYRIIVCSFYCRKEWCFIVTWISECWFKV